MNKLRRLVDTESIVNNLRYDIGKGLSFQFTVGDKQYDLWICKSKYKRSGIELNLINTGRSGIYNCKLEQVNSQPEELKRSVASVGVSDEPFVLKAGEQLKFNLYTYSNIVERFAVKEIEKIQLVFFNNIAFNFMGNFVCFI